MNRGDLASLNSFVVVADQLSFRAASAQLGITASAVSARCPIAQQPRQMPLSLRVSSAFSFAIIQLRASSSDWTWSASSTALSPARTARTSAQRTLVLDSESMMIAMTIERIAMNL
jgi:hypothetical protein